MNTKKYVLILINTIYLLIRSRADSRESRKLAYDSDSDDEAPAPKKKAAPKQEESSEEETEGKSRINRNTGSHDTRFNEKNSMCAV